MFLAVLTVGLGFGTLDRIESIKREGEELRSFNKFVETCEYLQYGDIGDEETVELSLNSSKIEINGNFAELSTEKGVKEAHRLPLPAFNDNDDNFPLENGTIQIVLSESDNEVDSELFFAILRGIDER